MGTLLNWKVIAAVVGAFLTIFTIERLRPLRPTREPAVRHLVRNLAFGASSTGILKLLGAVLVMPVATWAHAQHFGLLSRIDLPRPAALVAGILLLDYTLWFWHWANHKVGFFWRFHEAHHVDIDVDASTALRFHVGELFLSVPYRALQIVVVGADPAAVAIWQSCLLVSTFFHHSNIRLPVGLERWLVRIIVTPRMHGIHHSDRRNEADTNYSSLLSAWDWLHRTMLLSVPQRELSIGVAGFQNPADVTFFRVLAMPFYRLKESWIDPDGSEAVRPFPEGSPLRLAE